MVDCDEWVKVGPAGVVVFIGLLLLSFVMQVCAWELLLRDWFMGLFS